MVNKLSKTLSVNYNKSGGQIVSQNKCFVRNENRMRFGNHGTNTSNLNALEEGSSA